MYYDFYTKKISYTYAQNLQHLEWGENFKLFLAFVSPFSMILNFKESNSQC